MNSSIIFHDGHLVFDLLPQNKTFGKLSFEFDTLPLERKPIFLKYTLDNSESMNIIETSENNFMSRLDYAKKTLIDMFKGMVELDLEIYVHVDTFSEDVVNVIDNTQITKETIDDLITKIDSIDTSGMTNIEKALTQTNAYIEYIQSTYRNRNILHILLTDGEPTVGIETTEGLLNLVSKKFSTVFIGYGFQHNYKLLEELSKKDIKHKYLFVDNYSKTGILYGEVIYNMLYASVKNIQILIENGLIYDTLNNKWVSYIEVPEMISNKEFVYHIQKDESINIVSVVICGKYKHNNEKFIFMTESNSNLQNLHKDAFRQKTMELLHIGSKTEYIHDDLLSKLQTLYLQMKRYMSRNKLMDDPFMKTLCDDLFICYRSLGTYQGAILSVSRNTSQREQSYYRACTNPTEIVDYMKRPFDDFENPDNFDVPPPPIKCERDYGIEDKILISPKVLEGVFKVDDNIEYHRLDDNRNTSYSNTEPEQFIRKVSG